MLNTPNPLYLKAPKDCTEEEYKKFSERYGMDVDTVKKYLPEDQIKAQILNEKAIAVVRDSAEATAPEEEEKPKKTAKKTTKKAAKKAKDEDDDDIHRLFHSESFHNGVFSSLAFCPLRFFPFSELF